MSKDGTCWYTTSFTKEERVKCLKSRITRCTDVNDSDSLRELLEPLLKHARTPDDSGEDSDDGVEEREVVWEYQAENQDGTVQTRASLPLHLSEVVNLMGTAMIDAAVKNSPEVVRTLLDLGVPIDHRDELQHTALLRAAEYGHNDAVTLLCERGADPNVCDSWTRTPIHWAAHNRHTDVVRTLLAHGALPDPVDKNYQFTPLMLAARMGRTEIVEMLLRRSNEIPHDANCMLCSTHHGMTEVLIKEAEEAVRRKKPCSKHLLGPSTQTGHKKPNKGTVAMLTHLLTCGDSKYHDMDIQLPVAKLSLSGRGLSSKTCDCSCPSPYPSPELPLPLCEWHKQYPRSAQLQRAWDVNHTDIHGENPLFDASRQGHWDIVHLLIDAGCNLNHVARFRGRQTAPILIARNAKNAVQMLVNLVRLNADLEISGSLHFFGHWNLPPEHVTAFQLAIMDGHVMATQILALGGARLKAPEFENWQGVFEEQRDREWVHELLFNPRSLKQSCRIAIRRCLCVKPDAAIEKLPLPAVIKHYLTVPELDQFEQYLSNQILLRGCSNYHNSQIPP